jgi:hypothetical protein
MVHWQPLIDLVKTFNPRKAPKEAARPFSLETMLRIH